MITLGEGAVRVYPLLLIVLLLCSHRVMVGWPFFSAPDANDRWAHGEPPIFVFKISEDSRPHIGALVMEANIYFRLIQLL